LPGPGLTLKGLGSSPGPGPCLGLGSPSRALPGPGPGLTLKGLAWAHRLGSPSRALPGLNAWAQKITMSVPTKIRKFFNVAMSQ